MHYFPNFARPETDKLQRYANKSFIVPPKYKMDKKKFTYLTSALLLLISGSISLYGQSFWISNDTAAHNLVWEEKLRKRIDFLADSLCGGRATGSRGATEAAAWLIRHFRDAGLMPLDSTYSKHVFAGHGTVGHNIVGMIPGSRIKPADSYIIIGAHYDHLGVLGGKMYPGADNNASGVAAMMSLADMFSAMRKAGRTYDRSIIFVAFDAKEMNMAGSEAFWRMIENGELTDPVSGKPITPEKIHAMANLEQIGSSLAPLSSGRKDYLIALGLNTLPASERNLLSLCNRFYGTHLELSETYYGSERFTEVFYGISDQKVFARNGIPAVFFTSGITLNTFKTHDTVGTLDLEVLRSRVILIFHWIEKLLG